MRRPLRPAREVRADSCGDRQGRARRHATLGMEFVNQNMIEYRPFHNTDPPKLTELWNFGKLGPGAALEFPNDALDMLVLSEPYFDKLGVIVACDGSEAVGFVHAGFGANVDETGVST